MAWEQIPVWNFRFWHFQNDFALGLVSEELPVSPLVLNLSLFFSLSVFLCFLCLVFVVGSVASQ